MAGDDFDDLYDDMFVGADGGFHEPRVARSTTPTIIDYDALNRVSCGEYAA